MQAANARRQSRGHVLAAGGRTWGGVVEADAVYHDLIRQGVPPEFVLRERCSLTTADNARLASLLLRRLGVGRVTLVTCDWHMPRAAALFRAQGLSVEPCPSVTPSPHVLTRLARAGHEWLSRLSHEIAP